MTARPAQQLTDWQAYHRLISRRLKPGLTVLDVGCGRGEIAPFPWEPAPKVELIGADVDPGAAANPASTRFVRLPPTGRWPKETVGVDLVLARYVLEHVESPLEFLRNLRRALKPGGEFLFLTPNVRHPAMAVSRVLPTALKRRVLARIGHADPADVFPSFYRMNTPSALTRLAAQTGFRVLEQETREYAPCGYLQFSAAGRTLARAYQRGLIATGLESIFGAQTIGRWRKG